MSSAIRDMCSLFPLWKRWQPASSAPYSITLGVMQCLQSSSYPLQCIKSLFVLGGFFLFLSPMKFWNVSSGNLEFYKGFLVCGCLPKSVTSRYPHCGREGLRPVHRLLLVPRPILKSVCILPDAQVGEIPLGSLSIRC